MLIEDVHNMYEKKNPSDVINNVASPLERPTNSDKDENTKIIEKIKKYKPTEGLEYWVTGKTYDIVINNDNNENAEAQLFDSPADNNSKNILSGNSSFENELIDYKYYILKQSLFYKKLKISEKL